MKQIYRPISENLDPVFTSVILNAVFTMKEGINCPNLGTYLLSNQIILEENKFSKLLSD